LVNQRVAREFLAQRGHQVVVANNGREAVEAFEREAFDLVLMDVQMPDMDGLEATRTIRRKEQTTGGHLPIVAMTAGAFKEDRERCLNAGMDAYLAKPIRPTALYNTIAALTTPGQPLPAPAPASAAAEAVLDWHIALEQSGNNEDLLRELITVFFEESSQLMGGLRQAIEQKNAADVRRLAHTIKGAANHFAASSAAAAALRLEMMGREGDLTGAEEALTRLAQEVERLTQALASGVPS